MRWSEERGIEVNETRDNFVGEIGEVTVAVLGEAGVRLLDEPLEQRKNKCSFDFGRNSMVRRVGLRGCGEYDQCVAELGINYRGQ